MLKWFFRIHDRLPGSIKYKNSPISMGLCVGCRDFENLSNKTNFIQNKFADN